MYKPINNYFEYYPAVPEESVWGVRVSASGHTHFGSGINYPPSDHPKDHAFSWENGRTLLTLQLIAIREGAGEIEWTGGRRELKAGDCIVLCPGVWHRYRPDFFMGWVEDWFELRGSVVDALPLDQFRQEPVVRIPPDEIFWRRFDDLHEVCRQRTLGCNGVAAGLGRALLATVIAAALSGRDSAHGDSALYVAARQRLLSGYSVTETASALGMSYPNFHRRFKAVARLSPKEYHAQIRHIRAEALLRSSHLSIKEIASQLGFHSAAHFSVEFKKRSGLAPAHWRSDTG